MMVREVMTNGIEIVQSEESVTQVAKKMRDLGVGALPVARDERIVGMVTDRDIVLRVCAEGSDPNMTTVGEAATDAFVHCRADEAVADAAERMENHQVRRMPVLDEEQRLVGMLSLGDLARSEAPEATAALVGVSRDG
ncbi:MAG: CBS domain-containing protein [Planctomycetota bacterium JB042]